MPTLITHRKVKIIVLAEGEELSLHARPSCIVLQQDSEGWWTKFVDAQGQIASYDQAYPSYNQALWAAKAAAEFGID
jgi:hypothetical protein